MNTVIYHNPRCSKSRQALAILEEQGIQPEVIEYLKTPPSEAELTAILKRLNMTPHELLRTGEDEYKTLDLKHFEGTTEALIKLMVAHPKLIERPIVVHGTKAVVGRPPESVLSIL